MAEIAAKVIQGFREMVGAWLLLHLLPQKLLWWQASSVGSISRWRCANSTETVGEVIE